MTITRSSLFVVVAFVLSLLATFVAGDMITFNDSTNVWEWMFSGAFASFMLSILV